MKCETEQILIFIKKAEDVAELPQVGLPYLWEFCNILI